MLLRRAPIVRGVGWEARYRTSSVLEGSKNTRATSVGVEIKAPRDQRHPAPLLSDVEFRKKKSTFRERLEYFEKKYPGILGLQLPPSTKYFSNTDEEIEKAIEKTFADPSPMGANQSMKAAYSTAPAAANGRAYKINGAEFHLGKALKGSEDLMAKKAFGTCVRRPADSLRFGCDSGEAGNVGCFNRHYAERSGYASKLGFYQKNSATEDSPMVFYDVCSQKPLFVAPQGRSWEAFVRESQDHGWPSFRNDEVVQENVRILEDGECVSVDGTHLGHNIPDKRGDRYCINLVSVAGYGSKGEGK